MDRRTHIDGKPFYCKYCGSGFDEYLACEHPLCELEDALTAQERQTRFKAGVQRSVETRRRLAPRRPR
jgi:hypothetical protein